MKQDAGAVAFAFASSMHVKATTMGVLAAVFVATAALAVAAISQRDLVLFNHSPSMPVGFYVRQDTSPSRGAIVTVRARDVAPATAQERSFDEPRDRFIKRVAATNGDEVCADGRHITINGTIAAERYSSTSLALGWNGCRILSAGEVLLLGESADSFDGRYWGPTSIDLIEGVWRKL